jgi:transcriptional regulator with XRE-family HTH domain
MRLPEMLRLRIKEVAQEKNVGMAKLSRISDLSYKTIQAIWHDPYHDASIHTLNKIAKALNIPATELLEDVPELPSTKPLS